MLSILTSLNFSCGKVLRNYGKEYAILYMRKREREQKQKEKKTRGP